MSFKSNVASAASVLTAGLIAAPTAASANIVTYDLVAVAANFLVGNINHSELRGVVTALRKVEAAYETFKEMVRRCAYCT